MILIKADVKIYNVMYNFLSHVLIEKVYWNKAQVFFHILMPTNSNPKYLYYACGAIIGSNSR